MPILLLYTAPSWCGYCRKLDDQLITQDDFKAYANKNLVLLISDHSDSAKGDVWKEKNSELVEACPIKGFPHMYLLTSDAENLGSIAYYEPDWSIQDYLDKIEALKVGNS
jgi:protein disulfide-isomerase